MRKRLLFQIFQLFQLIHLEQVSTTFCFCLILILFFLGHLFVSFFCPLGFSLSFLFLISNGKKKWPFIHFFFIGLDSTTLKLVSSFKNIIYISCNPSAFKKNFENFLCKTHNIKEIAFFDQFPYTEHIECGFHLEMKEMN